jgi:hypothetical protein
MMLVDCTITTRVDTMAQKENDALIDRGIIALCIL